MSAPRLLDLYCGAGGAAKGYMDAGFIVDGVDIVQRHTYPGHFARTDALSFLAAIVADRSIETYSLIHLSPPCQAGCALTAGTNQRRSPQYTQHIPQLKQLLAQTAVPYIIEQPAGNAPIRRDITLCGEYFGLGVIRHRHFELGNWTMAQPAHKPHRGRVRGWRHGQYFAGPYVAAYGNGGGKATITEMQTAMGITWTTDRSELTEAIPPAYTHHIGDTFLRSMP